MQVENTFKIMLAPDAAWNVLMDIARIAPCMPGAELVEQVDPRTYKGRVSVRLGPVSLALNGTASFEHLDEHAKRARVRAQGADSKGRGGAVAIVDFAIDAIPEGSSVLVTTDLNLSGAVAQYGRAAGVIQAVANQLISQFAENLRHSLETERNSVAPASKKNQKEGAATAAPISGFSLIARLLWDLAKRPFARNTVSQR